MRHSPIGSFRGSFAAIQFAAEAAIWQHAGALSVTGRQHLAHRLPNRSATSGAARKNVRKERVGVSRKPGLEGPSRLDMVKVWLLDPRSRLVLRRRLAEFRLTRRSVLAAGMAVWLLYAALVWQFGGRRMDDCTSLACRALLGGLPLGRGDAAPPAAAAGPSTSTPMNGVSGLAPSTTAAPGAASTTTTSTIFVLPVGALVPSTTGAPTAGEPTSTTIPDATAPGPSTTTTTTTVPEPECKPKKNGKCKPKKRHVRWQWWLRNIADFRGGW
jgi:hypothetical protein